MNTPAFPVYSMEDDERTALVAAGSVWFDDEDEYPLGDPPPTGIFAGLQDAVSDAFSAAGWDGEDDNKAERLRDLLEDEEIYARRDRQVRLHMIFAADQEEAATQ